MNSKVCHLFSAFLLLCIFHFASVSEVWAQSFTTNLDAAYQVVPGQPVHLSVVASRATSYQWYLNTRRSIDGATPIAGATSSTLTYYTDGDGKTEYIFCRLDNNATKNSTIAVINSPQSSMPTAPLLYYEYTTSGTKVSLSNNGNYAPIRFTTDGSDPLTDPNHTAITIRPYDGIHAVGSTTVSSTTATTLKACCLEVSGMYTVKSVVSSIQIAGYDHRRTNLLSWNYDGNAISTAPGMIGVTRTAVATDLRPKGNFSCEGITMTEFYNSGSKKTTEGTADKIVFEFATLSNNSEKITFTVNEVMFRINKTSAGTARYKYEIRRYPKNSTPVSISGYLSPISSTYGWTEVHMPMPNDTWTIKNQEKIEVIISAWDLETNQSFGVSNVAVVGLTSGKGGGAGSHCYPLRLTSAESITISPVAPGNTSTITFITDSGGKLTATSSDESVVSCGTPSKTSVTVTAHKAGTATITVHQASEGNGFGEMSFTVLVNVVSGGVAYLHVDGDIVRDNLTSETVLNNPWMTYTGEYCVQTVSKTVRPLDDAKTFDDELLNMISLRASGANTVSFNLDGAQSIALYVCHEGSSDGSFNIREDGGTPTVVNFPANETSMVCYDLKNASGRHTIQVTNASATSDVYIYAVKFSNKKSPVINLLTASKTLNISNSEVWNLRSGTDYTTSSTGDISVEVPDNPYIHGEGATVTPVAPGEALVYIHQAADATYRATTKYAFVNATRNEVEITQGKTWYLSNISENDGEYEGLYWDAKYGKYTEDGLNGLICNARSDIHFNLPAGNTGGVVYVTFASCDDQKVASIRVNTDFSRDATTLKNVNWVIPAGTRKITLLGTANTNQGVITAITWEPLSANSPNPSDLTGTPAPTDNQDGTFSMKPGTYTLHTSGYIKKIVLDGRSDDDADAAMVTVSGCTAETGNAMPGSLFGRSYSLTFIPTNPTQTEYTITITGQTALVAVHIYSYNYSRDITGDISAGKLGTVCFTKAVEANKMTGAKFFEIAHKNVEGGKLKSITFVQVDALEAGMPYIFIATDPVVAVDQTGADAGTPGHKNGLYGAFANTYFNTTLSAAFDAERSAGGGFYLVSNNVIQLASKSSYVGACRAYIRMSEVPTYEQYQAAHSSSTSRRRLVLGTTGFYLEDDTEETGISAVENEETTNLEFFNLSGQKVCRPSNDGLYIHGGKLIYISK